MSMPPGGSVEQAADTGRIRGRTVVVVALIAIVAVALSVAAWVVTRGGSDPRAQADRFLSAVEAGDFGAARGLLCEDGRDEFGDVAEMRERLAPAAITGHTLGGVTDGTYEGDKRKKVDVSLRLADGSTGQVILSMTKQSGTYLVCGF